MDMATIETALGAQGLIARGGFYPEPGDSVPALDGGRPARSLVVIGNRGPGELEDLSIFIRVSDLASRAEMIVSPLTRLGVGDTVSFETTSFRVLSEMEIQARVDPFASTPDSNRSNNFLQMTLSPPPTPTPTPTVSAEE